MGLHPVAKHYGGLKIQGLYSSKGASSIFQGYFNIGSLTTIQMASLVFVIFTSCFYAVLPKPLIENIKFIFLIFIYGTLIFFYVQYSYISLIILALV